MKRINSFKKLKKLLLWDYRLLQKIACELFYNNNPKRKRELLKEACEIASELGLFIEYVKNKGESPIYIKYNKKDNYKNGFPVLWD